MTKYIVSLRDGKAVEIQAEDVQVSPQGNVKFLNGKKANAVLVAFFNSSDVVSIVSK